MFCFVFPHWCLEALLWRVWFQNTLSQITNGLGVCGGKQKTLSHNNVVDSLCSMEHRSVCFLSISHLVAVKYKSNIWGCVLFVFECVTDDNFHFVLFFSLNVKTSASWLYNEFLNTVYIIHGLANYCLKLVGECRVNTKMNRIQDKIHCDFTTRMCQHWTTTTVTHHHLLLQNVIFN